MDFQGYSIYKNYQISKKLDEGAMSSVWIAENPDLTIPFIAVKILNKNTTSSRIENVIRFKNEAMTVSKLHHPNIIKILEIGEINDQLYIASEYIEGKSLKKHLEETSFPIDESIEIIHQIASALTYIHSHHIIHKDLKPGNIMLTHQKLPEEENKIKVKIIDFGLSDVKELSRFTDKQEVAGTFYYMSPEQTGIVKYAIDERSDLYSLGALFYELLTGTPPFTGKEAGSVIHQHIARKPMKPREIKAEIPEILEKIVLKLLEKEPEKRYQSAEYLLKDLEKTKNGETDFIPGGEEKIVKLNYHAPLIGREKEINALSLSIEKILENKGCFYLVNGETGTGKTRLIQEIQDKIYGTYAFIDIKCFLEHSKISYGIFKDILNFYLKRFETYPDEKKDIYRKKIKEITKECGALILQLNPMMSEFVEKPNELVELDKEQEKKRFIFLLADFFKQLANLEIQKGFFVFIDDIQWTDRGSWELLELFLENISRYPIFILAACRPSEIAENHFIRPFLDKISYLNHPYYKIDLKNLDEEENLELVSSLLYQTEDKTRVLADFLYQKSMGNPFLSIEILKQMVSDHIVFFKENDWFFDSQKTEKNSIPLSVIEIFLNRINKLNENEKMIIASASVFGRMFEMQDFFEFNEGMHQKIVETIDKSIQLQLIEKSEQNPGTFVFIHDKIQNYFYFLLSNEQQKAFHLKIAALLERKNPFLTEENLFRVLEHYIKGENEEKILEYSFKAGLSAKNLFIHEKALRYLFLSQKLLKKRGFEGKKEWLETSENIGEIYLIIGKVDQALAVYQEILLFKKTTYEKAAIYQKLSFAYFKKGDPVSSEKFAHMSLALLKERCPKTKIVFFIKLVKELFFYGLISILPDFLLKKTIRNRAVNCLKVWNYYTLDLIYAFNSLFKYSYTILRSLNISKRIGQSSELALTLNSYSGFFLNFSFFKKALSYNIKAMEIQKKLKNQWGIARTHQTIGFIYQYQAEYDKSIESLSKSIEIFEKIGDLRELGISLYLLSQNYYYAGDYKKSSEINTRYMELFNQTKDNYGISGSLAGLAKVAIEKGSLDEAEGFIQTGLELSEENQLWYVYSALNMEQGVLFLKKGEPVQALNYLEKAKEIYYSKRFFKPNISLIFPLFSEAYLLDFQEKSFSLSLKEKKHYLHKIKKSVRTALKKTRQWHNFYSISLRSAAKYYQMIGKTKKAEKMFLKTIQWNEKINRKYELALSYYEYGNFLAFASRAKEAKRFWEKSYFLFQKMEIDFYLKKLNILLGINNEDSLPIERLINKNKLHTIIKANYEISATLNLNILLEKILDLAMEITGSQKGILLLKNIESEKLEVSVNRNIYHDDPLKEEFSSSIIEKVFSEGEALITTNACSEKKYLYQSVLNYGLKSILCSPIKYKNEIFGVCYLDNPLAKGVFTMDDRELLNVLMTQAAISIENARLYQYAILDTLTQLVTRKHFYFLLQKEISRTLRYQAFFALLIIDLDDLKYLNENYGNEAGDEAIRAVAKIIRESCRNTDTPARFGGEQFAVILPETNLKGAEILAGRIVKKIENQKIDYQGYSLKTSASIGISLFPYHASNQETLIKTAEEALCVSKKGGKSKVSVYEKKSDTTPAFICEPSNSHSILNEDKIKSIFETTHEISSFIHLEHLLDKVISIAVETTGAERGFLMLEDEVKGELQIAAHKNINKINEKFYSQRIVEEVFKTGNIVLTTDAENDSVYKKFDSVVSNKLKSVLCVPILYKRDIKGVCYLDHPYDTAVFKKEDISILNVLMTQTAVSIENTRLYKIQMLETEKKYLEKINSLKNEFLGIVSHDLRSPIGKIQMLSSYIINNQNIISKEDSHEFLSDIKSTSQFILNLIEDLLDISKIEMGHLELCKFDIPAENLIQQIILFNQAVAKNKTISIVSKIESGVEVIHADEARIKQVCNNLLNNALKFSLPHSKITIQVSRKEDSLLFQFIDQGPGIPEAEISKLFQKEFYQTSVKSTDGEKGTGLGLSIVKKIVELHGGQVGVESQIGKGSNFYFTLPL
ncbi:MAG TPA: hypothetical protein DHW82_10445 [Spirochaetia bacterium]|nr:MAG: hypothetical protein A2Y41_00185 [Spirochaetes bacterium GWB1_36_13]HCL57411.1 hypothetical protein [Spirochaetia bacterium]